MNCRIKSDMIFDHTNAVIASFQTCVVCSIPQVAVSYRGGDGTRMENVQEVKVHSNTGKFRKA